MQTKSKKITKIISGTVITALFLSPFIGYAKNNDGNRPKGEKEKSCMRALGHLVAPGWNKHNDKAEVGENCKLPFGIGKKIDRDNPKPPVNDTIPPVISDVTVSVESETEAVITWNTNEKSNSTVFLSTATPVNLEATSTIKVSSEADVTRHRVEVDSLSADTTYYLVVRSTDESGNTSFSATSSFATRAVVDDEEAPIITRLSLVSGIGDIWVSFITDEPSTAKVYYGTNASIETDLGSALFREDAQLATRHSVRIPNLSADTLYHLVIKTTDESGNASTTAGLTLRTADND